jgi:GGDEF domain-containing protein
LARAVREASRNICGEPIVSVSVGSAFFPTNGLSVEDLLSEADRSMYENKEKHYSKLQNVS